MSIAYDFKIGDKVRYISNEKDFCHPEKYTVGEVIDKPYIFCTVRWPAGSVSKESTLGDYTWFCLPEHLEPVTEGGPVYGY